MSHLGPRMQVRGFCGGGANANHWFCTSGGRMDGTRPFPPVLAQAGMLQAIIIGFGPDYEYE
ncbi:hypothetical protein ACRE_045590 [Hapsidospora chrysogenum ATCC 11550]|uniref:Uncharacterized protein n=1 Tax=Hapsidospora chrysogenum (strain ATCC 11550 / CBS 779.69 / DSM 880 / IAM 14645 / JCM 23072 / IMI 49137) TaxID=857340 RepID=A0A086T5H5_HAPC1|nr:hypothetical protein ACRE_045590 [Hapsidospora chrysogenum ATCC 11550]